MNNTAVATKDATNNLELFAHELSVILDQPIEVRFIWTNERIYYYIQGALEMHPMLLNHYRGGYFVEMNPKDLEKLKKGEISPSDYIRQANWLVGYFWGGGSMVGGGYYQPMNILDDREKVQKYLKTLDCRGTTGACHYMPSKERCKRCPLTECWFSDHKEGRREDDIPEPDPRHDLFKALRNRFEKEYPGYTLRGLCCSESLDDDQAFFSPNGRFVEEDPRSFLVFASDNVIRSILMHTVEPENWEKYASTFKFVMKVGDDYRHEVTLETLEQAADENDYVKKQQEEEKAAQAAREQQEREEAERRRAEESKLSFKILHFLGFK